MYICKEEDKNSMVADLTEREAEVLLKEHLEAADCLTEETQQMICNLVEQAHGKLDEEK